MFHQSPFTKRLGHSLWLIFLTSSLIVVLLALAVNAPSNKDIAVYLEDQGYKHAEVKGVTAFNDCPDSDLYGIGFKAMYNERPVEGVVCQGAYGSRMIRATESGY